MSISNSVRPSHHLPAPSAILELLKPITWFPPMWAFMCGVVSISQPASSHIGTIFLGVLLTGPLVCATSQAVNDWFDREVDAINEPHRPIPSGRIPGRWGLYIGIAWTVLSLCVAAVLGKVVIAATVVGLILAWVYSAPPLRLKQNGWFGNTAVGACYEGLPWITGAAILSAGQMPDGRIITMAALYSAGAVGIMILNDFKSIKGDTELGLKSIPVQLGAVNSARFACVVMTAAQVVVVGLLFVWGQVVIASIVSLSIFIQISLMRRFLTDPEGLAPWYNKTGISLYVSGMLATAIALRILIP